MKTNYRQAALSSQLLQQVDTFGKDLPTFNINGQKSIKTSVGGCVTLLIMTTMLLFSLNRIERMVTYSNPNVNSYVLENELHGLAYNLISSEEKFAMAFALENSVTEEPLVDHTIFKWFATYKEKRNGNVVEQREVPMRVCTAKDMEKFELKSKNVVKKVNRHTSLRSLHCIDSDAVSSLRLHGDQDSDSYSFVDIMAIPCGQKETEIGAETDRIRDDCNWNKNTAVDYLRNLNILVL